MKILIFGTGDYYERYKDWFAAEDIVALLDNSPTKQHTVVDGKEVFSPQEGVRLVYDAVVILSFYVKAMKRQLTELGVTEDKIYHFYDLHELICCGTDGQRADYKKTILYYGGAENVRKEETVLLLSHDLTMGGPALALCHMAQILKRQGRQVVMASMMDGPLRKVLVEEGVPVVVDHNLQVETMREAEWTWDFSMIVCNTVNFHVFLSERPEEIPVLWWLHDSSFFYDGVKPERLCGIPGQKMQVCAVSPVAREAIKRFLGNIPVEDLIYGVPDEVGEVKKKRDVKEEICFVTIGYIEARKGQDILVQAIKGLPEEIRRKAVFYIVGQDTSRMAVQLREKIRDFQEVIMTGVLDRGEIHELLEKADVLICPSREDPMPTVAAEAMMHSVPCILSDVVGTAAYIQEEKEGLIFESEDIPGLAAKVRWCVEHRDRLEQMGKEARRIYEQYFSMDVFKNKLIQIMETSM